MSKKSKHLLTFLTLVLSLSTLGCSMIAQSVVENLAERRFNRKFVKEFEFFINNADAYRKCLDTRQGLCEVDVALNDLRAESSFRPVNALATEITRPETGGLGATAELLREVTSAQIAADALRHPVQKSLNDIYNAMGGFRTENAGSEFAVFNEPRNELEITFPSDKFEEYLELVESATILGGWEALAAETEATVASFDGAPDEEAMAQNRRMTFIREYIRAYFRNGRFYRATIQASELRSQVADRLRANSPFLEEETANQLVEEIFSGLNFDENGNQVLFGKIGTDGFVSRGGESYQFPAIEAKLSVGNSVDASVTDVDFIAVGSDLVRVLLHAVFDSHHGLPGVTEATGVGICLESNGDECVTAGLETNRPEDTNVSDTEFGSVENWATRIEGVTSAGVGRVIRGVSWLSLNNEALAGLIETAIGVTLRKSAEKFAWCWYACKFNEGPPEEQGLESLGDFAVLGNTGESLKIKLTVEAPGG